MNNTQNDKIAQVTNETMVIGIDIGVTVHGRKIGKSGT